MQASSRKDCFMCGALQRILKGKDNLCLDMVLPCFGALLDRSSEMPETQMLTKMHTRYLDLWNKLNVAAEKLSLGKGELQGLKRKISHFKKIMVYIFDKHCTNGLFT